VRDDGSANLLRLTAVIAERDVLRYTPAGIPIVNARLQHISEQVEAGVVRKVEFEVAALVAGEISGRFNRAPLGAVMHFTGFLARKSRNSKGVVFHVTDFETQLPDSDTGAQDGIR
jgi:primosomal replication protein N